MNDSTLPPESKLFDFLYHSKEEELQRLIAELQQQARLESQIKREADPELSLPLLVALEAFQFWSKRCNDLTTDDAVTAFLKYANSTVPYYQRHQQQLPQPSSPKLNQYPVVSKQLIIRQYSQFIATPYINSPRKFFKPTSGSTGKSLFVWYDLASFYDLNYASYGIAARIIPGLLDAIPFRGLAGIQITDDPITWRASTILTSLKLAYLQRRLIGINREEQQSSINELQKLSIPLLCGIPTCLVELSEVRKAVAPSSKAFSPHGIFVSGENLFDNTRALLKREYGCDVINAYTSSEGGFIAIQCQLSNTLHVREDAIRLEILDANGQITEEGAGEILLTNLMNWAMPFIRYRTGDYAVISQDPCKCGHNGQSIVELTGREHRSFTSARGLINPRILDSVFTGLNIKDYQVVQLAEEQFQVKCCPTFDCTDTDQVAQDIKRGIRDKLGNVNIEYQLHERITQPGMKVKRYICYANKVAQ